MASSNETCVTDEEFRYASVLWEYMEMNHVCKKSDVILCLGSYDIRVAERAASLWLQGMGDLLVFSGNSGRLTANVWNKPEAEVFSDRAREMGVPDDKVLLEAESTNTGENVRFTYKLLSEKGIYPKSVIIVQKPFMERRAYSTFIKQWPGEISRDNVMVTSPELDLKDYPIETTGPLSAVITVLTGDFARFKPYEEKGFQIHQEIPESAQKAFEKLIDTGKYNDHMPIL